jgi:hypothetical protein
MTQPGASPVEKEPFLAVLEYILIPKYIKFLRQSPFLRGWTVGRSKDLQSVETGFARDEVRVADFK